MQIWSVNFEPPIVSLITSFNHKYLFLRMLNYLLTYLKNYFILKRESIITIKEIDTNICFRY